MVAMVNKQFAVPWRLLSGKHLGQKCWWLSKCICALRMSKWDGLRFHHNASIDDTRLESWLTYRRVNKVDAIIVQNRRTEVTLTQKTIELSIIRYIGYRISNTSTRCVWHVHSSRVVEKKFPTVHLWSIWLFWEHAASKNTQNYFCLGPALHTADEAFVAYVMYHSSYA
jgi:hypothetical protein